MSSHSIEGQNAIVTGGARGLGRGYALRLAEQGANVAIADIDLESYREYKREEEQVKAETVMDEIEQYGVKSLGIQTDVTDPDAVQDMADRVVDEFGSIDIVIANAGGGVGPIEETYASELDLDHLHATVERNLYGTIYTCISVSSYMKSQKSGKIITVSSQAGREAQRNGSYAHYGAAKAAIIMYTKYLAQDVGRYGITANAIAPGYIGTGRLMESFEQIGVEAVKEEIALGRIGNVNDCAKVVEFLASELSDYMNGAIIPIDGGSTRS